MNKLQVYYNSACPVCDAGINSQIKKESECAIQWNDVHKNNKLAQDVNPDIELVRERLHVIDENNTLHVGIDAFIAIWANSPKEKWKANVLSLPLIKPFSNTAYNGFARLLYKWNKRRGSWE